MSDLSNCREILEKLIHVFDEIDTHINASSLWDEDQVKKLHLKRQQLTAQLHKELPRELPPALEDIVTCLHEKTKHTLALFAVSQQESRDAVFQLQNYRKAKSVYRSVDAG